jgi:hypothetical protein
LFFLLRYILFILLAFAFCFCSSHLKKFAASRQTFNSDTRFRLKNTLLGLCGGRRGITFYFSPGRNHTIISPYSYAILLTLVSIGISKYTDALRLSYRTISAFCYINMCLLSHLISFLQTHFYFLMFLLLFCIVFGVTAPQWARASIFTMFLNYKQRRTTVDRTLLDVWSTRRGMLLVLAVCFIFKFLILFCAFLHVRITKSVFIQCVHLPWLCLSATITSVCFSIIIIWA